MCGEHLSTVAVSDATTGSSPHVRGAHGRQRGFGGLRGIIPACAGSTWQGYAIRPICRDHPRMCGEHRVRDVSFRRREGSSPHVRGALQSGRGRDVVRGIIPACAGSTCRGRAAGSRARDHPRMCGEHPRQRYFTTVQPGSSPHVRGAPVATSLNWPIGGIIPACAGSTNLGAFLMSRYWDHPRMCGEHLRAAEEGDGHTGSSPHVRGARLR